jgi:predicted dehydrogenase
MKIGIVILGIGRWGVHWVRNFSQHPQVRIVAVVDPDPARLAECKAKLLPNEPDAVMATDWQQVRQLSGIDAVVVATPASTHYPLIADALKLGYHVLAEKPLTLDPVECVELTRLAEKQQRQLLVDHTYLFNPAVVKGQQVVRSNLLGQLRYGYATRTHLGPVRQDVDALWDLAIHDIAIFNHWLGQMPIEVQANGSMWLQQPQPRSDRDLFVGGLNDLVWLTLTYPDGIKAYIHLCWLNPDKQRRLCLVGDRGTLIFDEMSAESPLTVQWGYLQQQQERFIPDGIKCESIDFEQYEPLRQVCSTFVQNILSSNNSFAASGWLGAQLVQTLTCLSQSLQEGGETIQVPQIPS